VSRWPWSALDERLSFLMLVLGAALLVDAALLPFASSLPLPGAALGAARLGWWALIQVAGLVLLNVLLRLRPPRDERPGPPAA
jgi:hypothetical protein